MKRRKKRTGLPNNLPDALPGETVWQTIGRRGGMKRAASGDLPALAKIGNASRAKSQRKPETAAKMHPAATHVMSTIDKFLADLAARAQVES